MADSTGTTDTKYSLTFEAELVQVSSRKLVSLDRESRVVFVAPDSSPMELAAFAPDQMFEVTVRPIA